MTIVKNTTKRKYREYDMFILKPYLTIEQIENIKNKLYNLYDYVNTNNIVLNPFTFSLNGYILCK